MNQSAENTFLFPESIRKNLFQSSMILIDIPERFQEVNAINTIECAVLEI